MATALSYPTISGVSGAPYISAFTDIANIQDTINYLYYGSTGSAARTSPSDADGIYGMLKSLQNQVTAVQTGINVHESVKYATTTTLAAVYAGGTLDASGGTGIGATITFSATGTQAIDGGSNLALNDRVLVKNGTTALSGTASIANGIYYVTTTPAAGVAGVLTRALDSDNSVAGEMSEGDFLYVLLGTTHGNEAFMLTTTSATGINPVGGHGAIMIGTDAVTFTQFVGVGSYYIGTTQAQISSANQALTGISSIALPGATSGTITLTPTAIAGTTALTIPARNGETLATTALAGGGTNASLTAAPGAVAFSNTTSIAFTAVGSSGQILQSAGTSTPTWSTATFPATAATTNTLLRANGTNWVASTVTYPATTTANNLLYSSATSAIGEITAPTTNNTYALTSVVSASASVTPTWTASTGTGSPVFSASPTFTGTVIIPTLTSSTVGSGTAALSVTTPTISTIGSATGSVTISSGSNNSSTSNAANNSGSLNLDVGTAGNGGTRGALNIGNSSNTGITINMGTAATLTGTKAINIGTNGTTGSTTTITIGTTAGTTPTINLNGGVKVNGLISTNAAAPTIASATTIAPTTQIVFVSGTTPIATITAPTPISTAGGQITIIPTGLFTTTTAGNIALASTAVVSRALIMTYDTTTTKWYPSY